MRFDIVAGGIFPDSELPDQTGTLRKLTELQGDDPADPHACAQPLLPKRAPAASRTRRVRIRRSRWRIPRSPRSPPTITILFRNSVRPVGSRSSLSFPTPERKVQKDLDIQEYTDPDAQSDDPAYARAQAEPRDLQHL